MSKLHRCCRLWLHVVKLQCNWCIMFQYRLQIIFTPNCCCLNGCCKENINFGFFSLSMQKQFLKKGSDHFVSQDAAEKKSRPSSWRLFWKSLCWRRAISINISQTGMVCIVQSRLQAEKSQLLFINIKGDQFSFHNLSVQIAQEVSYLRKHCMFILKIQNHKFQFWSPLL